MKNQFRGDTHQIFVTQQHLQNSLGALGFHRQLAQDFFHGGNGETRAGEGSLDLFLCPRLFRLQSYRRTGAFHDFALQFKLFLCD
jgi:hypothetical protein